MGAASLSEVMSQIIGIIKPIEPDSEKRLVIYQGVAQALWDHDADTLDECIGEDEPTYTLALKAIGYLDEDYDLDV